MKQLKLKTPLTEEEISKLQIGDIVYLSGKLFTARDKAHKRIIEFLNEKKKLPFDLTNGIIFHAGPIARKEKNKEWKIFSLGPTTSSRMNLFTRKIIKKFHVHAIIGKGGMSKEIAREMKNSSVYLAMTGGCSSITTEKIKEIKNVYWLDLSLAEAVFELEVENFGPLIVAIDAKGNSLYEKIELELNEKLKKF
jgi:fumarate hydratase subunit beta